MAFVDRWYFETGSLWRMLLHHLSLYNWPRSPSSISQKLLSNLNPHKAAGPDQIKPIILNNISTPLSPILKHRSHKSLDSGTLPPIWKDANVAPVYKKGERSNPDNYMPISLTCILCKTLEHIVPSSITKHLSKLNIFYELQHELFREKLDLKLQDYGIRGPRA